MRTLLGQRYGQNTVVFESIGGVDEKDPDAAGKATDEIAEWCDERAQALIRFGAALYGILFEKYGAT